MSVWTPTHIETFRFATKVAAFGTSNRETHIWAVGRHTTSPAPASQGRVMDLELFFDITAGASTPTTGVVSLTKVRFEALELSLPSTGVYNVCWSPKTLSAFGGLPSAPALSRVCVVTLEGLDSSLKESADALSRAITQSAPSTECEVSTLPPLEQQSNAVFDGSTEALVVMASSTPLGNGGALGWHTWPTSPLGW